MRGFEFGNAKNNNKLRIGENSPIRLLVNVGHMDTRCSLDVEKTKVDISIKNNVDIIADNSVTSESYALRKWIKRNYDVMLNTVPIYETFSEMKTDEFNINKFYEILQMHIDCGVDMIVLHPGLTNALAMKVKESSRLIKVTSRGGSQIFRYITEYGKENPCYEYWDEICKILSNTGVAVALGFALRGASIVNDIDEFYLEEMDIIGHLISRAPNDMPILVEGVGHVKLGNLPRLLKEIKTRCHDVPIKTLGPLLSDRMLAYEHINSLLGGMTAAINGVSIIGAIFRSEHLGLPSVEDFEECLPNYRLLKYIVNMSNNDYYLEENMSKARASRQWIDVLNNAYFQNNAKELFAALHLDEKSKVCSMCGERCALISFKE